MTGYQEILTDPSYAGQIVTLTYPHIGNVGVNAEDVESRRIYAAGLVIRDLPRARVELALAAGPRRLTCATATSSASPTSTRASSRASCARRARRTAASSPARVIDDADAPTRSRARAPRRRWPGSTSPRSCRARSRTSGRRARGRSAPATVRWARRASTSSRTTSASSTTSCACSPRAAAGSPSCRRRRRRATCWRCKPDGVFLSNGPGDPEPCDYAIAAIREIVDGGMPTFGICLGHQLLGLAAGGRTLKMKFGHHGANHPVLDRDTGQVLITSQNHGFAVDPASLPAQRARHARVAVRRHLQGIRVDRQAGVLLPGPSGGEPGPARRRLPVRPLREADGEEVRPMPPSAPTSRAS